ncbi:hypothetical protein [Acinetobacter junii]|uniref:hypothetical protein n=1 Tax=Acinetobacter junii TaxID=40215 RepID=UPI00124FB4DB|nr:hypothetical protein [Acinetobacter junii]
MDNYKIKVNDEAESKEAQELFFEMGYKFEFCADIQSCRQSEAFSFPYFVQATEFGQIIFAIGQLEKAKELTLTQLRDLVAQSKSKEQGLISGADALNDYSNAQVSYDFGNGEYKWFPLDQCEFSIPQILKGHNDAYDSFALAKLVFRLKPRTITLNVEIPAPFEPKEGEEFFILAPLSATGYTKVQGITTQVLLDEYVKLGAWRTEEEIKQVVAALRGGIKG